MLARLALAALSLAAAATAFGGAAAPPSPGDVVPSKPLMAALGDSITAAAFAGTSLVSGAFDVTPEQVDASLIGSPLFENKDTLSWASGKIIDSHYKRFDAYLKTHGRPSGADVLNLASTGDTAADVEAQAAKLVEAVRKGSYLYLAYVTLLIGANDACSRETPEGTPDAALAASLGRSFDILASVRQLEPVRVLVSVLPNIALVGQRDTRERPFYRGWTCGQLWSTLNICQNILNWSTPEELAARERIVKAKNAVIRQAIAAAKTRHPQLQIAVSEKMFVNPVRPEDMAGDCFHPNRKSQERIAQELWQDQPWFR